MNKEKHLEMIQGVVNRMASNSFFVKGWMVAIAAAILALSIKENDFRLYLVILVPNTFFWWLDSYYLYQEKLFRKLYDFVCESQTDTKFSMDTEPFRDKTEGVFQLMFFNKTIRLFYIPFYVVTSILTILA